MFVGLEVNPAFPKAPNAPTIPETDLKVLPTIAQEFFQNGQAPVSSIDPSAQSPTLSPERLAVMPREVTR